MSEYKAKDTWQSSGVHAEPHCGADSDEACVRLPRLEPSTVLAQIPDVTDQPDAQPSATRRDGRVLSQGLSARILLGGGVALFLIAAMPFLFGRKGGSDSASTDPAPTFQVQPPAPDAPLAPKWDGKAARTLAARPGQSPDGDPAQSRPASPLDTATPQVAGDPGHSPIAPTSQRVAGTSPHGATPSTPAPPGPWQYPSTGTYPDTATYPNTATYPRTDSRATTRPDYPAARPDYTAARPSAPGDAYPDRYQANANQGMAVGDPNARADRYDPRAYQPANRSAGLTGDPNAAVPGRTPDYRRDYTTDPRMAPGATEPRRDYPIVRREDPAPYRGGPRTDPAGRSANAPTGYARDTQPYDPASYRPYDPNAYRPADPRATPSDPRGAYQADRRAYDPNLRRPPSDSGQDPRGAYYPADPRSSAGPYDPHAGSPAGYGERYPAGAAGDAYYSAGTSPRVADQRLSASPAQYPPAAPPAEEPGVARFRGTIEKPTARSTNDGARSGIY